MTQLLLLAVAMFISEDLTCIATGALIAAGKIGFFQGALACVVGIYFGDLLLYFAGRFMGRLILRWRPLRRLLTNEKLDAASLWLEKRGAGVVILSRFTPGLRLPTYVAAGLLKTRFWSFALYFLLAAVLWTPVLVGAAALLGKSPPSEFRRTRDSPCGFSLAQVSAELAVTALHGRLVSTENPLGILAALAGVYSPRAVHSVPGNQASLSCAVYGSQSRDSIRRLRRRIQIRNPGESGSGSGFHPAVERSPGRRSFPSGKGFSDRA